MIIKERQNEVLLEKLRAEKEAEEKRQEEMRLEAEAIRQREEELRREQELEERRKRELEELAKRLVNTYIIFDTEEVMFRTILVYRKEEIANLAPALPSLAEEEDQIVEFGQTKLHELAAQDDANLMALIKQNINSLAARNSQNKTPRDVANDLNLVDNVKQIGKINP